MEPESQLPQFERNTTLETRPGIASPESRPNVDQGVERSAEQFERSGETRAVSSDSASLSLPQIPMAMSQDTAVDDTTTQAVSDDSPIIAADEDLIEKEWVDKAKKIIADTKEDPYRRETEVNKLQADYIEKRYSRKIGQVDA